jgi:ADP-ribose pyrophosphatase
MDKFPRAISAVIAVQDDKVLLVKEVLENGKEYWIFPGGGVEFGESTEDAAVREMKEEIGLSVKIDHFVGFKEVIRKEFEYHTIVFFYMAEPLGEVVISDKKILEARYFTLEEANSLQLVDSARWALTR